MNPKNEPISRSTGSEAALRETQRRLEFALGKCHTGSWELDLVDHTAHRSLEHDRIFGYDTLLPQWTYEMFLAHVLPEDRAEVARKFSESMATQTDWDLECRIRRPNGEVRSIWAAAEYERDASGNLRRLSGIVQDVTERVASKAALARSEAWLRIVTENAHIGLALLDPQRRFTYANTTYSELIGLATTDVIGRQVAEVLSPVYEAQVRTRLDRAFAGERVTYERSWPLPDGEHRYTATYEPISEDGTVSHVLVVIADVTARRNAEDLLRLNEARLQQVFDAAPVGMLSVNAAGVIDMANVKMENLFGYTRDELLGQGMEVLVPEQYRDGHAEHRRSFFASSSNRRMCSGAGEEVNARRKDGSLIPVEIGLSPVETPAGWRVIASVTDLTRRKKIEEDLATHVAELAAASKYKSEFLANMSHELRTPLNAVIGFGELLQEGVVPLGSPEANEFLGDIVRGGRHLLALINDVLDVAKLETGRVEFHPEPIDLPELFHEIGRLQRPAAEAAHIAVSARVDPALAQVTLDRLRLTQIITNYFGNALKFTPKGGAVQLRALPEGDTQFRIEVEDSGIGIAERDIPKLFVQFQQLDAGAAKRHQGTGIGLALTRRLVEAQGGSVGVRSEVGAGSTFWAILPRWAGGESPAAVPGGGD